MKIPKIKKLWLHSVTNLVTKEIKNIIKLLILFVAHLVHYEWKKKQIVWRKIENNSTSESEVCRYFYFSEIRPSNFGILLKKLECPFRINIH